MVREPRAQSDFTIDGEPSYPNPGTSQTISRWHAPLDLGPLCEFQTHGQSKTSLVVENEYGPACT